MDKNTVVKPVEYPKDLEERISIEMDMDILKSFFKNMSIINSSEFLFKVKGKEFYFHTKGFNEVTEKIEVDNKSKNEIILKLGRAFIDAIENLSGLVILELKSDYPITVTSKTADMNIRILVAPIVQE